MENSQQYGKFGGKTAKLEVQKIRKRTADEAQENTCIVKISYFSAVLGECVILAHIYPELKRKFYLFTGKGFSEASGSQHLKICFFQQFCQKCIPLFLSVQIDHEEI